MYESPIQLIIKEMRVEMDKKRDEAIWNAVEGIGVNVDKEELIKALQYDRDQYKKGYVDGVKAFAEKLMNIQARVDCLMPSEGLIRHLLKEMGCE